MIESTWVRLEAGPSLILYIQLEEIDHDRDCDRDRDSDSNLFAI